MNCIKKMKNKNQQRSSRKLWNVSTYLRGQINKWKAKRENNSDEFHTQVNLHKGFSILHSVSTNLDALRFADKYTDNE